jgi:hypothetical protein
MVGRAAQERELAAADGIREKPLLKAQLGKALPDVPSLLAHNGCHRLSFLPSGWTSDFSTTF